MPLTQAEKSKRYREKLKRDPVKYEYFKKQALKRAYKAMAAKKEKEKFLKKLKIKRAQRNEKENAAEQDDSRRRNSTSQNDIVIENVRSMKRTKIIQQRRIQQKLEMDKMLRIEEQNLNISYKNRLKQMRLRKQQIADMEKRNSFFRLLPDGASDRDLLDDADAAIHWQCDACDGVIEESEFKEHRRTCPGKQTTEDNQDEYFTDVVYLEDEDQTPMMEDSKRRREQETASTNKRKIVKQGNANENRNQEPQSKKQELQNNVQEVPNKVQKPQDELDSFGTYVVALMRSLPKSVHQKLQMEIINKIMEEKFKISSATCRGDVKNKMAGEANKMAGEANKMADDDNNMASDDGEQMSETEISLVNNEGVEVKSINETVNEEQT